ncbi:MAG: hypothetical protein RI556_08930 [Hydrogenovibrio sp.]|uniref:hypothetical protein n=1 Tax=Hydrogenovibrio sp. TaxID=2065821 RepID=UPI0028702203|nr:hypothetical protein [Hydrogenovibrio sp.]MDR9499284.1 hypothetical protein [Hydrogenovibrio sp.]
MPPLFRCHRWLSPLIALMCLTPANAVLAEIEFSDDLSDLTPAERAWLEGEGPRPDLADTADPDASQSADDDFPTRFENHQIKWLKPEAVPDASYYLVNRLTVTPDSLRNGWMRFEQCHHQLDAINKIEVVYNSETTRALEVTHTQGIGRTQTQSASVILQAVSRGASVCIQGQSQTLVAIDDRRWQLRRGPYMRKFFNGYYPMHLQETLNWSQTELTLTHPESGQPLGRDFDLNPQAKRLSARYWFEGELRPVYQFRQRTP